MKKIILYFILFISSFLISQIQPVGLQGMNIYSLAQYGDAIYAGTEDGVYWLRPDFSYWQPMGLQGKKIKSVYPHQWGPIGSAITVSVLRDSLSSSERLIYCTCDQDEWNPQDSGINRTKILYFKDLNGFPSPVICGETFAGGFGKLYRRNFNTNLWELVFNVDDGELNVVKANQQTGEVWVGGQIKTSGPYIVKSRDKGKTWAGSLPILNRDNECYSILFDDTDTNIIYAGMKGIVIKSTNKGSSWKTIRLNDTSYYFYAMAKDYVTNTIFAGGSSSTNEMGLFKSTDAGETWLQILPLLITPIELKGISSLLVVVNNWCCEADLYIGTMGDGIYIYHLELPNDVKKEKQNNIHFYLSQNYPNPFNPTTTISYQIPFRSYVNIKIFDVLGNKIKTLVDEYQDSGFHSAFFTMYSALSSGVYFYQLQAGKFIQRKKMIILK